MIRLKRERRDDAVQVFVTNVLISQDGATIQDLLKVRSLERRNCWRIGYIFKIFVFWNFLMYYLL